MIKRFGRWISSKVWSVEIPFLPMAVQFSLGLFWPIPVRTYVDGEVTRKLYHRRQFYSFRRIMWSPTCVDWLVACWPMRAVVMVKDYGYGRLRGDR